MVSWQAKYVTKGAHVVSALNNKHSWIFHFIRLYFRKISLNFHFGHQKLAPQALVLASLKNMRKWRIWT